MISKAELKMMGLTLVVVMVGLAVHQRFVAPRIVKK
jgi:hypothetical protein